MKFPYPCWHMKLCSQYVVLLTQLYLDFMDAPSLSYCHSCPENTAAKQRFWTLAPSVSALLCSLSVVCRYSTADVQTRSGHTIISRLPSFYLSGFPGWNSRVYHYTDSPCFRGYKASRVFRFPEQSEMSVSRVGGKTDRTSLWS